MPNRLLDTIKKGRAPHAILITGPEGSGRRELARRCAALYCLEEDAPARLSSCPNYCEIGEAAVKVDDIRTLLSSAAMQGFNGGKRAFVFLNAQNLSTQIQNTLLKTLEEPHDDTLLILTGNEFGLLPTIRSRCLIERLGAGNIAKTAKDLIREGANEDDARFYASLADGILSKARAYATEEARAFRSEALAILERAIFDYAPFSAAAELVTVMSAETETGESEEEETKEKSVKKKKKGDRIRAQSLLTVFESVFRDALNETLDGFEPRNGDRAALICRIASCFTTARIQGIIEMLANAQRRLSAGAGVYLTIDGVLAKLFFETQRAT
jgi:DNA polymerase III delta prime subunit